MNRKLAREIKELRYIKLMDETSEFTLIKVINELRRDFIDQRRLELKQLEDQWTHRNY